MFKKHCAKWNATHKFLQFQICKHRELIRFDVSFRFEKKRESANCLDKINSNNLFILIIYQFEILLKIFHDYFSKSDQLKIIRCFFHEYDVIFSVKINYEKSMILYSLSALNINNITLLIMSLSVLKAN